MIVTIAEHSLDIDLLPQKAHVLDIGAKGLLFANEMARLGHEVFCVDVQQLETDLPFARMAITGYNGFVEINQSKDPQAVSVKQVNHRTDTYSTTIAGFSLLVSVLFWDLIKIDVEGSEYDIFMSLTEPPSTQISWEAHLHTGIYGMKEVKEMEDKLLSLGYFPVKHDKYPAHGLSENYWDSLFILQK